VWHLDRHHAIEFRVADLVDRADRPDAKLLEDFKSAKLAALGFEAR
jgi:hypothetical protein